MVWLPAPIADKIARNPIEPSEAGIGQAPQFQCSKRPLRMTERSLLERFVDAQESVYAQVLEELRAGRKRSHWMWFVFPQLRILGRSETARYFGIAGEPEARFYLAHPLLGPRLRECTGAVLAHPDKSVEAIFGAIDAMKFRSSMTLFEAVADTPEPFSQALRQFHGGERDLLTLRFLDGDEG